MSEPRSSSRERDQVQRENAATHAEGFSLTSRNDAIRIRLRDADRRRERAEAAADELKVRLAPSSGQTICLARRCYREQVAGL